MDFNSFHTFHPFWQLCNTKPSIAWAYLMDIFLWIILQYKMHQMSSFNIGTMDGAGTGAGVLTFPIFFPACLAASMAALIPTPAPTPTSAIRLWPHAWPVNDKDNYYYSTRMTFDHFYITHCYLYYQVVTWLSKKSILYTNLYQAGHHIRTTRIHMAPHQHCLPTLPWSLYQPHSAVSQGSPASPGM